MAFDTYDNLKKAVLGQTHRGNLSERFDDFLAIAEVEIRSNPEESLKMNLTEQVAGTTASLLSRNIPLPQGFQSSRKVSITLQDTIHELTFRTPDQMIIRPRDGVPVFFTVRANQIEFDIIPDEEYSITITYNAGLVPLSKANQTNEVLTKYPNIYLFGCLKQSAIWLQDIEQSIVNDGLFLEAIVSANMSEHAIKYPTQPQETVHWAP